MKKVLILTVMLAGVTALGFSQTTLSGTYRYSANAYITFTGSNFTGSWNRTSTMSGTFSVSGSRLTLNITGGTLARNTWTWTVVDANTLRDQDGDSWRKEGGVQAATPASPQNIVIVEQGNNLAEKLEWLSVFAQSNTNYIVEVNADENIGEQRLAFGGKNNITITYRGIGTNRTLIFQPGRYSNGGFNIDSNITLVLDSNITLRKGRVFVDSGGTLIMNNGSTITDSYGDEGGGVYVAGTFIMNGGIITGNRADNGNNNAKGGGVFVAGGTFIINGGTISGNTDEGGGGGVYVNSGTFTMNGGTISSNTSSGSGGGVYVERNGTFTMSGGIISGNTASRYRYGSGGGVYVEDGTFTMSDGTISGNTARESGGGVSVSRGTFTMSGGTISSNIANRGGGVNGGNFTMRGGIISGNTASENGGGVYVTYGTFIKTGGTIYGYNASDTNSNVVKNSSGTVQNFKGHAVWAGSADTLLKIREGTAGSGDNMSYYVTFNTYGDANPPTASGAWDN